MADSQWGGQQQWGADPMAGSQPYGGMQPGYGMDASAYGQQPMAESFMQQPMTQEQIEETMKAKKRARQQAKEEKEKQEAKETKQRIKKVQKIQKENDANGAVNGLIFFCCFNAFTMLVPVFGPSWATIQFVGLGIKTAIIRTSLFHIDVNIECGKNFVEDYFCKILSKVNGEHDLMAGNSVICTTSQAACSVMNRVYWASMIIFFCYTFAIISSFMAGLFLYMYWYSQPLPKLRQWALIFLVMSPILSTVGLFGWSMFCPQLSEIPQGLQSATAWVGGGTQLIGYKEVQTFPFGWCWVWSCVAIFFQWLSIFIWPCFFRRKKGEDKAEEDEEREKDIMDARKMGMQGPPGQGDPYQQQYGSDPYAQQQQWGQDLTYQQQAYYGGASYGGASDGSQIVMGPGNTNQAPM